MTKISLRYRSKGLYKSYRTFLFKSKPLAPSYRLGFKQRKQNNSSYPPFVAPIRVSIPTNFILTMETQNNNGSEPDPSLVTAETPELMPQNLVNNNPVAAETSKPQPEKLSNNNGSELDPNPFAAESPVAEKLGTSDGEISIEKSVERITLTGDPPSVEVNGNEDKDDGSEGESSESESESSTSSSSSSSTSGSDTDEDDDDDAEEEEEGEISDDEKMVSWSAADGDLDDEDVVVGPIRSKNEIQVFSFSFLFSFIK